MSTTYEKQEFKDFISAINDIGIEEFDENGLKSINMIMIEINMKLQECTEDQLDKINDTFEALKEAL